MRAQLSLNCRAITVPPSGLSAPDATVMHISRGFHLIYMLSAGTSAWEERATRPSRESRVHDIIISDSDTCTGDEIRLACDPRGQIDV